MERRYFLALLLAAAVVAITQFLFPVARPVPSADVKRDTSSSVSVQTPQAQTSMPSVVEQLPQAVPESAGVIENRPEITRIETQRSIYEFTNIGAAPVLVRLKGYKNLAPAGGDVELRAPGQPLLRYALVVQGDTVSLDRVPFRLAQQGDPANGGTLSYSASVSSMNVTISYNFIPDRYLVTINGRIDGQAQNVYLVDSASINSQACGVGHSW